MKKILTLLLLAFIQLNVIAQSISSEKEIIEVSELKFQGSIQGYPSQYQTRIAAGTNFVLSTFYNEMDDISHPVYKYGKCELRYHNDRLYSFNLLDNGIYFTIRGTRLQVGRNISTLSNAFPKAYQNRVGNQMLELWFGDKATNKRYDASIRIFFDSSGIIYNISDWSPS